MTSEIKHHYTANGKMKKKDIMVNNLVGGMAWGIGSVVGATVVVGAIGYLLNRAGILNIVSTILGR